MKVRVLGALRVLGCLFVFVGAFLAVALVIRRALPFPEVPIVWEKLTHWRARHGDYDTLFLGSSRVQYQIVPRIFDEVSARQGLPTRSFNAGVAGMRPPEDSYLLDQLLAARPSHLRWVFIELAGIRSNIGETRRGTMRVQYWHDAARLGVLWRHALQSLPTTKRWTPRRLWREMRKPLGEFLPHLALFLREQSNIGKGAWLTRRLQGTPPPDGTLTHVLGEDLAGWIPTGRGEDMISAQRAAYEREVMERHAKPAGEDFGDRVSQEALEAMIARIEDAGATPVLIVPPTTGKKRFLPTPERQRKTLVLDFSSVTQFPELFEIRHRLDPDHTNTAGAEVLTRLLARRWLAEAPLR